MTGTEKQYIRRQRREQQILQELWNSSFLLSRSDALESAVLMLQAMLGVETDGNFGSATETALKAFQNNTKITADGICGKETWINVFTHAQINTFK